MAFIVVLILFSNLSYATDKIDTKWVYDETNSISQKTVDFVDSLNEDVLKDYQYAIYVVDSIDGTMDDYKLKLFNDLGVGNKETNSGILFVLATGDREYGIEIGDGIQGKLRSKLDNDFVKEVAINELKSGDWDLAVLNVSAQIAKIIKDYNESLISPTTNTAPNNIVNKVPNKIETLPPRSNEVPTVWILLIIILASIIAIIISIDIMNEIKELLSQNGNLQKTEKDIDD